MLVIKALSLMDGSPSQISIRTFSKLGCDALQLEKHL